MEGADAEAQRLVVHTDPDDAAGLEAAQDQSQADTAAVPEVG